MAPPARSSSHEFTSGHSMTVTSQSHFAESLSTLYRLETILAMHEAMQHSPAIAETRVLKSY